MPPKEEEIYKLVKENNQMLRQMRRNAMIGGIFKFIWWIVILVVLPYLTYLYLQPYLEQVMNTYQGIQQTGDTVQSYTSFDYSQIEEAFKKYFGGQINN